MIDSDIAIEKIWKLKIVGKSHGWKIFPGRKVNNIYIYIYIYLITSKEQQNKIK